MPAPDVSWLDADTARFGLEQAFVLVVPGGAVHRPAKRWPAAAYGELCAALTADGLQPVLLGTAHEQDALHRIAEAAPGTLDLGGQTELDEIAALARQAAAALGNDTGPMHLIAAAGCAALVLYGPASDPALTAPRGDRVAALRHAPLADLPVAAVMAELRPLMQR